MLLHSVASLRTGVGNSLPHVIISNLEHDSIDLAAKKLQKLGYIGMMH